LAVAAVERAVTERTAFRDEGAFVEQDRIVASVPASPDARDDARAFTEKRAPHGQGRCPGARLQHESRWQQ
jgi:enoyl-CoA hydratase